MRLQACKAVHYDSGPNMTPLVDVVMVILIFLMLAGAFGAAAHFLPTGVIRRTDGPIGSAGPTIAAPRLEIFVSSRSDGMFVARLGGGETFRDAASLKSALEALLQKHQAAGTPEASLEVLIRPRLSTRHVDLMAVYEAAMDAKWPKINFAIARD